ncbi:BH0509 family protein [Solibacillus sp. FSL H8-0538]
MTQEERDELVFICSMMTNFTEECLQNMPDAELERIYNKNMNASL